MARPQPEKRLARRFSLELPVKLLDQPAGLPAQTRDVSSHGVYLYLDSDLVEGAAMDFVMTLPGEITLAEPIRVRCAGRVLRIEKAAGRQGIAVSIERYDFVREQ